MWSLIGPYDIGHPITTKDTKKNTVEAICCCVLAMWMISGQSVQQSMTMRNWCPPWEQKLAAISWNEHDGRFFLPWAPADGMVGSFGTACR